VPSCGQRLEIASGPTAEIENTQRRRRLNVTQKGIDVLTDVVVAGAVAKSLGVEAVIVEGALCRAVRIAHGIHLLQGIAHPSVHARQLPAHGPGEGRH